MGAPAGHRPRPAGDQAAQEQDRRREFPAARQLITEAQALISPTCWMGLKAHLLVAEAEVHQLAGDRDQGTDSLHAALRIYEDRRTAPLAAQVKAALASLATSR